MQEQSFQAKLVKECIRLAAGNRLIGPKIKMGAGGCALGTEKACKLHD